MIRISKIFPTLLLLLFLGGCASLGFKAKYEKNWPQIKTGMTKNEVEQILGKPDSIISEYKHDEEQNVIALAIANTIFDGWFEKWCYGKSSILTTYLVIPFGPPGNIYVVYFDKNGEVVGLRKPVKEDNKNSS